MGKIWERVKKIAAGFAAVPAGIASFGYSVCEEMCNGGLEAASSNDYIIPAVNTFYPKEGGKRTYDNEEAFRSGVQTLIGYVLLSPFKFLWGAAGGFARATFWNGEAKGLAKVAFWRRTAFQKGWQGGQATFENPGSAAAAALIGGGKGIVKELLFKGLIYTPGKRLAQYMGITVKAPTVAWVNNLKSMRLYNPVRWLGTLLAPLVPIVTGAASLIFVPIVATAGVAEGIIKAPKAIREETENLFDVGSVRDILSSTIGRHTGSVDLDPASFTENPEFNRPTKPRRSAPSPPDSDLPEPDLVGEATANYRDLIGEEADPARLTTVSFNKTVTLETSGPHAPSDRNTSCSILKRVRSREDGAKENNRRQRQGGQKKKNKGFGRTTDC